MAANRTAPETTLLGTIDDYLGPRARRFFGEGFKRADHRITDVRIDGGAVSATATVDYPADWSRKGDRDQRPHLSTVDVLVLGAWLVETQLAHTRGLTPAQRAGAVLHRADIKAGTTPVEEELRGFRVTAGAPVTTPAADGRVRSVIDCVIGTLTLRCEIDHEPGLPNAAPAEFGSPEEILGEEGPRLFAEGHRNRRQFVEQVRADVAGVTAGAEVRIEGPGVALSASALTVDTFVVGLQLGQVLLYELDSVSRARSNTLWMRRTVLSCERPGEPRLPGGPVVFRLEKAKLLENSKGQVWRAADIVGEFQGVRLRCSVAHRLP
ncbi:AvrD family protein [Amycolatopsis japonica]|uniref:AvrD family protein n=1 Tax=Amycolatopsis japonica TaxID=208439 RepID=UPI003814EB0E